MTTFKEIAPAELALKPFEAIDKGWMLVCGIKPDGSYNAMTASWGALGTLWARPVALAFIRSSRYTKEFLDAGERVTLSLFEPGANRDGLMVMGRRSGRDCDKVAESGLAVQTVDGLPVFSDAHAALLGTKLFAQDLLPENLSEAACRLGIREKQYVENTDGIHTLYVIGIDTALVAE